jgi:hypothetical protein
VNSSRIGTLCSPGNETQDFLPATLYTFHRAFYAYWRWFRDLLKELETVLGQTFGGAPPSPQ